MRATNERPGAVAIVLGLGMTLGLCARCAELPQVAAAANTTISTAQQDVQAAINLYGIAKGLGQVASLAEPGIAPVVAGITAVVDPDVARAQAALNDATTDANALKALASAIRAQANALTLKAAPAITAVPNKAS